MICGAAVNRASTVKSLLAHESRVWLQRQRCLAGRSDDPWELGTTIVLCTASCIANVVKLIFVSQLSAENAT